MSAGAGCGAFLEGAVEGDEIVVLGGSGALAPPKVDLSTLETPLISMIPPGLRKRVCSDRLSAKVAYLFNLIPFELLKMTLT